MSHGPTEAAGDTPSRIALQLVRLGTVLVAGLAPGLACESVSELPLRVLLPEDRSPYEDIDNISLVISPGGEAGGAQELTSFSVNGLDFSLQLELSSGDEVFSAALFLAKGSELRAWGQTPDFTRNAPGNLSVFVGAPGQLSTFPRVADDPDPNPLSVALPGRGALIMEAQGRTLALSELSLELNVASPLAAAPPLDQGLLLRTREGHPLRLAWGSESSAAVFDLGRAQWVSYPIAADTLSSLDLDSPALRSSEDASRLWIAGPSDLWELDLSVAIDASGEVNDELRPEIRPTEQPLDGSRTGADGHAFVEGEQETFLLFGVDDTRPVLWADRSGGFGPSGPWIGGGCIPVNAGAPIAALELLCGGGLRANTPTRDLLRLERSSGAWAVTELLDALPIAVADPIWMADDSALYAQGAGALLVLSRDAPHEVQANLPALRHARGDSIRLETGATFLVGGVDSSDAPLLRWQVFTPTLPP